MNRIELAQRDKEYLLNEIGRLKEIADTNYAQWQEQTERVGLLITENRVLAESLLEAMEWNWLDKDWNEAMFDTFKAYADKALASISGNQK